MLTVSATEIVSLRDDRSWAISVRMGRIEAGGNSEDIAETERLGERR